MIPALPPPALGQEIAACAVLGGCTGAVRAFFPVKSRAAILPDVLWVGAVLTAVQSYAAGESYAGVLRWYMAAAAFAGETGRMIALERISSYPYQCIAKSVDVQQVANLEKKVPLDWITPDGMQVTAAFEEYARPLILDEVTPVYVNGTPRHIRL